jgi:crossover junction endodeoxyribonuclease RusA
MTEAEPCRTWELEIPLWQGRPPLDANMRLHWRPERARKQFIRDAVQWRLLEAKVPPCEHVTARVHYLPEANRTRDASNLMPTQKAAVDALKLAGVVPDDCAPFVTELMPVIYPAESGVDRRLWLEVRCG